MGSISQQHALPVFEYNNASCMIEVTITKANPTVITVERLMLEAIPKSIGQDGNDDNHPGAIRFVRACPMAMNPGVVMAR